MKGICQLEVKSRAKFSPSTVGVKNKDCLRETDVSERTLLCVKANLRFMALERLLEKRVTAAITAKAKEEILSL